jgi:hypothetical protein
MEEIRQLEEQLEDDLAKLRKKTGYDILISLASNNSSSYIRYKLAYWHSAIGNKVWVQ